MGSTGCIYRSARFKIVAHKLINETAGNFSGSLTVKRLQLTNVLTCDSDFEYSLSILD